MKFRIQCIEKLHPISHLLCLSGRGTNVAERILATYSSNPLVLWIVLATPETMELAAVQHGKTASVGEPRKFSHPAFILTPRKKLLRRNHDRLGVHNDRSLPILVSI
jgi:hypothetical protein